MKTILFVLHDHFAVRNFIYSPFIRSEFARDDVRVVFVVQDPENHEQEAAQYDNVVLEKCVPGDTGLGRHKNRVVNFLYKTIEYRFNVINDFNHIKVKESIPEKYIINKTEDAFKFWVRFPVRKSKLIFRLLKGIYNSGLFLNPAAKKLMQKYIPDLVVTSQPQMPLTRSFHYLARKKGVRSLSYVNSWDFLTTDGPVLRAIDEFVVWNKQSEKELQKYHRINKKPVHRVGPVHMDTTFEKKNILSKKEISEHLGMDPDKKIIIFGTYNKRLGSHEPGIVKHVAQSSLEKLNAQLIIRGHPYDESYYERYGEVGKMPGVIHCKGKRFLEQLGDKVDDQTILYSILAHADALICSATTLSLDGVRFDVPIINLGFDGDLDIPPEASVERKYTYNHYAPLLQTGGIELVRSYEELDTAISEALERPEASAEGRTKIREEYLEPLDGHASERLYSLLLNKLRQSLH